MHLLACCQTQNAPQQAPLLVASLLYGYQMVLLVQSLLLVRLLRARQQCCCQTLLLLLLGLQLLQVQGRHLWLLAQVLHLLQQQQEMEVQLALWQQQVVLALLKLLQMHSVQMHCPQRLPTDCQRKRQWRLQLEVWRMQQVYLLLAFLLQCHQETHQRQEHLQKHPSHC